MLCHDNFLITIILGATMPLIGCQQSVHHQTQHPHHTSVSDQVAHIEADMMKKKQALGYAQEIMEKNLIERMSMTAIGNGITSYQENLAKLATHFSRTRHTHPSQDSNPAVQAIMETPPTYSNNTSLTATTVDTMDHMVTGLQKYVEGTEVSLNSTIKSFDALYYQPHYNTLERDDLHIISPQRHTTTQPSHTMHPDLESQEVILDSLKEALDTIDDMHIQAYNTLLEELEKTCSKLITQLSGELSALETQRKQLLTKSQ